MEPVEPIWMKTRAHWRRWLERNHGRRPDVWLAYFKAHTGKPSVIYAEAVEEALCYGWIDGQVRRLDDESWCQRFTPRRPGSAWSKLNLRRFARLTELGLVADAGRAAGPTRATKVATAFWDRPDVTPPEIAQALKASRAAWAAFQALAPYKRKLFVTWLLSAKRPETRARRVAQAIEMLEQGTHPMDKYKASRSRE